MIPKEKIFIYFNYFISFLGSIIFLIGANFLNLINIDKYIFLISISTIFASSIYASAIKSKLEDLIIKIDITNNSLRFLFFLLVSICTYLTFDGKFLLIPFLLLVIFYDLCFNLFAISFIKRNNTLAHSKFLFFLAITKNSFLFLSFITDNFLIIVSLYNAIFIIYFIQNFLKLKIIFQTTNKPFNTIDLIYVFLGSLVFQIDKILGESFLTNQNYYNYFLIFKFASIFQIIGSILTQPIRNQMISSENISNKLYKNLKNFIFLLLILLVFANLFFLFFNNIEFFNKYIFQININTVTTFNILSLSIIVHVFNGFYIDILFIKNYGKKLVLINFLTLTFMIIFLINFKSLIFWSFVMLASQIFITIFVIFYFRKYVRIKL